MTRPENAVAIAERALAIEGSVSPSALRRIDKQGNFAADPTTAALFASFAFADLPIGWTFSHVWSVDDPGEMQEVDGIVEACTQQFGEPFEEVPHGWKTIILFRFQGNVPELVTALPVSDSWTYQPVLRFGSKETWCAAVANASADAEQVDLHSIAAKVDDESSFLDFIQRLAVDRAHEVVVEATDPSSPWGPGANGWENGSIEAFLSAAAAWGAASGDGLPHYAPPGNAWQRCAQILLMGKHYE